MVALVTHHLALIVFNIITLKAPPMQMRKQATHRKSLRKRLKPQQAHASLVFTTHLKAKEWN